MKAANVIAILTRRWGYAVEEPGAGRLVYREGNREYTFPAYEDHGDYVLVGVPSSQRVHLFFNWYPSHHELPETARLRMVERVAEHLAEDGSRVRLFERGTGAFDNYPELLECRTRAADCLESAGYLPFSDYGSIQVISEEHGLEINGIRDWHAVRPMIETLQRAFPHWHHQKACRDEESAGTGWSVALSMFPMHAAHSEWNDGNLSE